MRKFYKLTDNLFFDIPEAVFLYFSSNLSLIIILCLVNLVSNAEMNGALGAYAKSRNTIYINSVFLTQNSANPTAVGKVIVEEEGHFLDAYASPVDSPGDEGEILAGLVQGKIFNEAELIPLKAEDDSSVFTINGQSISVELASPSDFGINLNSNSYTQAGGNVFRIGVFDQCTEFAYGRALEKGLINQNSGVGAKIRGNAKQWDDQAGSWSNQARANSFGSPFFLTTPSLAEMHCVLIRDRPVVDYNLFQYYH